MTPLEKVGNDGSPYDTARMGPVGIWAGALGRMWNPPGCQQTEYGDQQKACSTMHEGLQAVVLLWQSDHVGLQRQSPSFRRTAA